MKIRLNGSEVEYQGALDKNLLTYLREQKLYSLKDGCTSTAACGCCTLMVNDKAMKACTLTLGKIEGKEILTLEGVGSEIKQLFADAFVTVGAVQCGFCTPGMMMQGISLVQKNEDPSREDVLKALTGNICRCTGYVKIVDGILLAAKHLREKTPITSMDKTGLVGKSLPKYSAKEAALGERPYVCDLTKPDMLYGALYFADHPRALVKSIQTEAAEKLPGVSRVFTAADVPGERVIGLIARDWPLMVKEGEYTRYVGDVIAGVVAESCEIARKAVSLIKVEYQVEKPLVDPEEALLKEAPLIHEQGNLLSKTHIKLGDPEAAFAGAAHVYEHHFTTQRIEHAFMETEAALAHPEKMDQGDGICVYSQGQGVFEDRRQIAELLKLDPALVRVILVQNGGGFGGKEDLTVQGHAALYASLLQKPVKIELDRSESFRMHPKRHPFEMDFKVACDDKGKLIALKAKLVADTGAYASVGAKVVERAVGHATGAYYIPNVDIQGLAVYTNNVPCGAMRGFGVNQSNFALESCVDELCQAGNFDRWQFRWDNALIDGTKTATGQIIKGGSGIRQTLDAVKDEYQKAKYVGIACGIKNTGIGNGMADSSECKVVIKSEQLIEIYHGWTEMGQGVNTIAIQTVCEETGLAPDLMKVYVDTKSETVCGMTTASRATSLLGNALINACINLKADLKKNPLAELVGKEYKGKWICDWTVKPGKQIKDKETGETDSPTHYAYSYATQLAILNDDGKLTKVVAAHDAGRIMNQNLFEGQIEGAIHMGMGYTLTEDFPMEEGFPTYKKFAELGILRAKDMPEIIVKGIEVTDPIGPYGAKGVGEIGLVPTASAITAALFQFDGKRRFELPIKEKKILRGK